MTRRVAPVLLLAALACATPSAAPALQNNGELRVLVILATWSPQPFTREQAQDVVFVQSDAFVRDNSYGAAHLAGETDTTGPSKPALSKPPAHPKRNRAFLARWEPSTDDGSGVDHYATQASVRAKTRGSHALRVVAFDRAGNKSRPAIARFSVR